MNSLIGCAKAIAGIEDIAMEVFRRALLSRAFVVTPARSVVQDFNHASTLFAGPLLARGSFARRKRKASHSIGAAEVRPAARLLGERGIAQLLHRYQNSRILRYQRTAGEKATLYQTARFRQIARGLALAAGRAGSPARAKRSCNSSGVKVCFAPLRGALQTLRLAVLGLRCAPYPKQEEALEHDASTCSIHPWLGASAFSFGRTLQRWRASASPGSPV